MGFMVKVVLVLAIVAGGVWAWYAWKPSGPMQGNTQVQQQSNAAPQNGISVSGSSDAALSADLMTIDSQVQAAQSDSAAADSSFNDKPVQQTE